jgi:hypothetical protein
MVIARLRQVLVQLRHHQLHDLDQVVFAERVEEDDFVERFRNSGLKVFLTSLLHHVLDLVGDHSSLFSLWKPSPVRLIR